MYVELAGEVIKMGAEPKGPLWNEFGWNCIKTLEKIDVHFCPSKQEDMTTFKYSLMGIDFIIKEGYIDMNAALQYGKSQEVVDLVFTDGVNLSLSPIEDSTEFILKLYFEQKFKLFKLFITNGWDFMAYCNICLKRLNNIFWINLDVEHFMMKMVALIHSDISSLYYKNGIRTFNF